jgi:hypothetical protein
MMAGLARSGGTLWIAFVVACATGSDNPDPFGAPQPGSSQGVEPGSSDGSSTGDTGPATTSVSGGSDTGPSVPETESSSSDTGDAAGSTGSSTTGDDASYDPVCGDGIAEGDEVCDGADLDDQTCAGLGFDGGSLACLDDCSGHDTSSCTTDPFCGDGVKNGTEQCDGADLGGETCQSLGWDMGALACTANCTFDTSSCANAACTPIFGNCSQVPCCAGLICLPLEGHHCAPL